MYLVVTMCRLEIMIIKIFNIFNIDGIYLKYFEFVVGWIYKWEKNYMVRGLSVFIIDR